MNHSRNILKWGAAAVATTALILGCLSAPALAKNDARIPVGDKGKIVQAANKEGKRLEARIPVGDKGKSGPQLLRDTGWGEV